MTESLQSAAPKIALVGMMASGKTTVGRALARALGVPFLDSDEEVVAAAGMPVAEVFAQRGEAAFRALERETVARLLDGEGAFVMSLGGGAFMQPAIRDMLREKAKTVFLSVGAAELARRLERTDIARRPLLAASADWRSRIAELLAERTPLYAAADIVFDANSQNPKLLAEQLAALLRSKTIRVDIARKPHAYDIVIGKFLPAAWLDDIEQRVPASNWILVADENVAWQYPVLAAAEARGRWQALAIPAGEDHKGLGNYAALVERLLALGVDRRTVLVAMGGGVVGDLVGFAAATLLRGLRFVQIPTTLLAQVDSSVGGKTGVNAAAGKNLVGAFHQPERVLVDAAFLGTLPEREYLSGMAEVAKYGILGDREFFFRLVAGGWNIEDVIARCCTMKQEIVSADETEKGRRGLLNLGHTFGHVLESVAGFDGSVVHGEAVSVGMVMAARAAVRYGKMPEPEYGLMVEGMKKLNLPVALTELGGGRASADYWKDRLRPEVIRSVFLKDKKAASGTLTLVLPHAIGEAKLHKGIEVSEAAEVMLEFIA